MDYKVEWLVPGRVIDVVLPQICDDAFLKVYDSTLMSMLDTASQKVQVIMDLHAVIQPPAAQSSFNMKYYKHPMMGRILTIGLSSNPVLRFLSSLVGNMMGIQIKDFGSHQEARAYLSTIEKI